MKQISVDSSMKTVSTEGLTLQIGCAESPLASFLLVLSFYGESLGGRGFITVLPTIALQAPLDRAHGELPSDTRTLISHWEKFRGKTCEIWRSVIATLSATQCSTSKCSRSRRRLPFSLRCRFHQKFEIVGLRCNKSGRVSESKRPRYFTVLNDAQKLYHGREGSMH